MKKQRGFTLIEVLIYMAIFALISVIVVSSLVSMSRALVTLRSTRGTTDATLVAFERMVREIQNATSTNANLSIFGTNPGTLTLNTNNTRVHFFLVDSTLMVQEGTMSAAPLTPPDVAFSSLIFKNLRTAQSEGVKIEALVNGRMMNTTAVLRGSY